MNETEHDERASQTSSKTTHSSSSVTSEATKARARAEAAHIRASFAEREARLKVESAERDAKIRIEKAKLDAELGAMSLHREAAAAMAEAEAFETAEEYRRAPSSKNSVSFKRQDVAERTSNYVLQQAEFHASYSSMPNLEPAYDMMHATSAYPSQTLANHQNSLNGAQNHHHHFPSTDTTTIPPSHRVPNPFKTPNHKTYLQKSKVKLQL